MIGFLVRGWVRIKIRIRVSVRVMFNVTIYNRINCRRCKCRTFHKAHGKVIHNKHVDYMQDASEE